ncbi:MAG TPA: winged helix-turn-helix domain-containing protein [Pyrinomonadaceae bacterium]|jgi:TolB-like protein/DNA-binding winged helix-turn-helix (wHTH) protein/Flp pilus assembly protein TadD
MEEQKNRLYEFGEFCLDTNARRLTRRGETLSLNSKTFDLLFFLAKNSNRTVTKTEILEAVWEGQFVEEANLSVQISALRKVLGEKREAPRFLVTVPGKGYKFVLSSEDSEDEEIVIEKHKIARVAIDKNIDEPPADAPLRPASGERGERRALFAGVGLALLFLLGLFGYRYFNDAPKNEIKSLAVLPFIDQTGAPDAEYLSDGLAESVIYSLSNGSDLRVMSRNSSFRLKGKQQDAPSAGRELNVEAVLIGRIAQFGDHLTVGVELVSTRDNSVIWGEQFTRKKSDLEKLQTDIAHSISRKLRLRLSGEVSRQPKTAGRENPEVYQDYLLGRYHLNKFSDDGFRKGREYFERAIEKDPGYAPAYAALAESYNRLCGYNAIPSRECFPKARQTAQKALELDGELAEAHATLGSIKHFYDWDFAGAEKDFKRAIEINPSNAEAHQMYSYYLTSMGRFEESLAEMRRAYELDPLSLEKINGIGEVFYFQRRYDPALEEFRKALRMDVNSGLTHWEIGRALSDKGDFEEAIAAIQKSLALVGKDSSDELLELARAYANSGKSSEARKIIDQAKRLSDGEMHFSPAVIASVYGALGEKDRAFALLEQGYAERDYLLVMLKVDPMFDSLRSDPRFGDLVRRVGLPN